MPFRPAIDSIHLLFRGRRPFAPENATNGLGGHVEKLCELGVGKVWSLGSSVKDGQAKDGPVCERCECLQWRQGTTVSTVSNPRGTFP